MLQAWLWSPPDRKGAGWDGVGIAKPLFRTRILPGTDWTQHTKVAVMLKWMKQVSMGQTRGDAEIRSSEAALSAMKKDIIKHIFISDLPPLCCWGQDKLSYPWKPNSMTVCCRGTILLRISSPAHSRPAILLVGLFRVEKLQFCNANSMRYCGLLTRQTSKKQVDCRGQIKKGKVIILPYAYIPLLVILKLTMLNLSL